MKIMLLAIRRETVHRKRWTFYALFGEERRDMMEKMLKKPDYAKEILAIMHGSFSKEEMLDRIADYHENDIAEAFELLSESERKSWYQMFGPEQIAEIFSYIDDPDSYLKELPLDEAAKVLSFMDSDDAVDILDEMDHSTQEKLVGLLDEESGHDILTIRQAMRELVQQAGENDNISTVYVLDENDKFYGAIDLKDLIVARQEDNLEDIISTSYPYVNDHEMIDDCIERIKDYAEDSIPVLTEDNLLIGVITAMDIIEAVDEEMGEDYAKLAGLTAEEDLKETTIESMKKRLPWLIILLFLGMGVSSVVGVFETVVAVLPVVMCFQSLILDMAGNVGTQSLAVTIRVLMDETLSTKQKLGLVVKEMRIGLCNGLFLGVLAFVFIGFYIWLLKHNPVAHAFVISGCVGFSLMTAMVISSMVGTLVPMFFHKIKIDPAVASGPLITTINDLVAVVTYYGLAWLLLIHVLHMV